MTHILSQTQLEGQLRGLRLSGMIKTLNLRLKQAESQGLSYTEFLGLLLEDEINTRADNKRQRLYKSAKLPFEKGLEDFDFTFQPSINRREIFELATCQFLEAKTNLLFIGQPGTGKTHDKKAADEARITYPLHATLDKDTGFQGYEPEGVLTRQPKKAQRPGVECR